MSNSGSPETQCRCTASSYRAACHRAGLPIPARNTVDARITAMHPGRVTRSRDGPDAARSRQSAGNVPPPVTAVLQQVQIDHTVVDLMIVDEYDRADRTSLSQDCHRCLQPLRARIRRHTRSAVRSVGRVVSGSGVLGQKRMDRRSGPRRGCAVADGRKAAPLVRRQRLRVQK